MSNPISPEARIVDNRVLSSEVLSCEEKQITAGLEELNSQGLGAERSSGLLEVLARRAERYAGMTRGMFPRKSDLGAL